MHIFTNIFSYLVCKNCCRYKQYIKLLKYVLILKYVSFKHIFKINIYFKTISRVSEELTKKIPEMETALSKAQKDLQEAKSSEKTAADQVRQQLRGYFMCYM